MIRNKLFYNEKYKRILIQQLNKIHIEENYYTLSVINGGYSIKILNTGTWVLYKDCLSKIEDLFIIEHPFREENTFYKYIDTSKPILFTIKDGGI